MNISNLLAIIVTVLLTVVSLFRWLEKRKHAIKFVSPFERAGSFGGPEASYMAAQKFRVARFFRAIFIMVLGICITEILVYPTINLWTVLLVGIPLASVLIMLWTFLVGGGLRRYFEV